MDVWARRRVLQGAKVALRVLKCELEEACAMVRKSPGGQEFVRCYKKSVEMLILLRVGLQYLQGTWDI